MGTSKWRKHPPRLSTFGDKPFVLIPHELLDSVAYLSLEHTARTVLIAMLRKYMKLSRNDTTRLPHGFQFPYGACTEPVSRTTFYRSVATILKRGFFRAPENLMDPLEIAVATRYQPSEAWRAYAGTPDGKADARRLALTNKKKREAIDRDARRKIGFLRPANEAPATKRRTHREQERGAHGEQEQHPAEQRPVFTVSRNAQPNNSASSAHNEQVFRNHHHAPILSGAAGAIVPQRIYPSESGLQKEKSAERPSVETRGGTESVAQILEQLDLTASINGTPDWKTTKLVQIKACGDCDESWKAWWHEVLDVIVVQPEALNVLEDTLHYIDDCQDPATREAKDLGPLTAPGKFLVNHVREWAQSAGVRLPRFPSRSAARGVNDG